MIQHRAPWHPGLLLLLGILTLGGVSPRGLDATPEEPPEQGADETEPALPDLGENDVPMPKRINEAIELGTKWLLARGVIFDIPKARDDEKGAHYGLIKGDQNYGGGKGPQYRHPAGPTALALYTLLKCGVDPKHAIIQRGFNWLKVDHRITEKWDANKNLEGQRWTHLMAASSYELSVMILALTAKYDQKKRSGKATRKRKRIRDKDEAEWLVDLCNRLIEARGIPAKNPKDVDMLGWRYNVPPLTLGATPRGGGKSRSSNVPPHANQDISSTQLAALALYSAYRFGVAAPPAIWMDIARLTLNSQEKDGPKHERHDPRLARGGYAMPQDKARGFMYIPGSTDRFEGKATGSMTCCGLANLVMVRDILSHHRKTKKSYPTSPLAKEIDTAIYDSLAWLDRNWSSFNNTPRGMNYHVYYLYAMERAMDMLGKRLIGKRAWYPAGAQEILKRAKWAKVKVPEVRQGPQAGRARHGVLDDKVHA